jgi:uncharacterized membrane protein
MDKINTILALVGTVLIFIMPYVIKENKKLNEENDKKNNLINSIKRVEKIKSDSSKLSDSELIDKL